MSETKDSESREVQMKNERNLRQMMDKILEIIEDSFLIDGN